MTDTTDLLDDLTQVVAGARFRWASEDDLQAHVTQAWTDAGHEVEREVRLSPRDRIDAVIGRVGAEFKVTGRGAVGRRTPAVDRLLMQLARYAKHDRFDALLVVTTSPQHRALLPQHV